MIKLAILFTQPPFGSSTGREGLDALLAASAFCNEDEILIGFINDGVFNLRKDQQPERLQQKDHIAMLKLIELYELSECYVCAQSLQTRGLSANDLILSEIQLVESHTLLDRLRQASKLLTF